MRLNLNAKKFIFIILVSLFIIISFPKVSLAGEQTWNSLDFQIDISENGDMNVVETWDVDIKDTNTLFKTFKDYTSDYYEITNVKISEIKNEKEIFLNKINEQQYHVDSGCYYGLRINSSEFEIAWNVGLDNSSDRRVYKMYYTVEDAVKGYADCTELYWQFLSSNNNMIGKNLTGRIKLPKPVKDIETLRIWGHGHLSAEIKKVNNQIIKFSQTKIYAGEMLEVRVVTEENIYSDLENTPSVEMLSKILNEEMNWADEANREREEARASLKSFIIKIIIAVLGNIFILMLFIKKTKKYKAIREELIADYGHENYNIEMEYFRDIPDEKNATPGRAVYLKNFKKNWSHINSDLSKIFAATILNLSLKKILHFEQVSEKEVKIFIENDAESKSTLLAEDEKIIFNVLKKAIGTKEYITLKEFNKFASIEYEYFYREMNRIISTVEERLIKSDCISETKKNEVGKWKSKQISFLICGIISIFWFIFIPSIPIGLFILSGSARKNAICVSILSYKGQEEVAMWNGLNKFMKDYSLLNEKLVPDIILWEKYLVYATAFGIADKVIEQLKVVHPEMFDTKDNYNGNVYGYWNIVSSPIYNDNFLNSFSKDLSNVYKKAASAYSAAHSSSSSGSGGGGGFSSGGGGGGGGGSCGGR